MVITAEMWDTWINLQEIQTLRNTNNYEKSTQTNFKTYLKWQIEAKVNDLPSIKTDDQIEVAGIFIAYDNRELVELIEKRAHHFY